MSAAGETTGPLGLLGQMDLSGVAESVGQARRYVPRLLTSLGHNEVDDIVLLVSEVVSNAVRHSDSRRPGGRVTLTLASIGDVLHVDVLHVEVTDAGSATSSPIEPKDAAPDDAGGRGLWLVNELATAWGWHEVPNGRVVWFQTKRDQGS